MTATTVSTRGITGENPVDFRVDSFGPNVTINQALPPEPLSLVVRFENGSSRTFGVTHGQVAGYEDALQHAVDTQAMYRVEGLESELPRSPIKQEETILHRFLNAIANRQIVPEDEPES